MSTLQNINANDLITDSRAVINDNFNLLNTDKLETSVLDTDTTLAANSDSKVPTQRAVKAYVDAGGNVNATETTKGIVEIATSAEVTAGTDVGATGASLVVTPSKLEKSISLTAGETINGATLPVPVYQNKTDNEFYACDANDTDRYKFLGFAVSNGTDGNALKVQFSGVVSGFTGLAEGEKYYVQDTVGTIGTTPGTQEILVGVAISETQLLIQKGQRSAKGNISTSAASGNSGTITVGFRPSVVKIYGAYADAANFATGSAIWSNSTWNSAGIDWDGAVYAYSVGRLDASQGSGHYITFTITSLTDTSFVITWVETGSTTNLACVWEAEGEL